MATKQQAKRAPAGPELHRRMTVGELREALGLSRKVFSRLTGFSERAIADWEAGKDFSEPTRQRMTEMQRLQQGLARVMKRELIADWLQTPNDAFGSLKPIEVVERGEIDRLWRMIYVLESGQPG